MPKKATNFSALQTFRLKQTECTPNGTRNQCLYNESLNDDNKFKAKKAEPTKGLVSNFYQMFHRYFFLPLALMLFLFNQVCADI